MIQIDRNKDRHRYGYSEIQTDKSTERQKIQTDRKKGW